MGINVYLQLTRKRLRERFVEVIGDVRYDGFDVMLPFEFVDRLMAKPLTGPMWHKVEGRASVASDDDRVAPFHLAGELSHALLASRMETVFTATM